MISKRLRESLDSSICIRDIFEEGKKLAAIYGAENIFNFTIGNPSVEPPAAVNEALKEIIDTEKAAGTARLSCKRGTSGSPQSHCKLSERKI